MYITRRPPPSELLSGTLPLLQVSYPPFLYPPPSSPSPLTLPLLPFLSFRYRIRPSSPLTYPPIRSLMEHSPAPQSPAPPPPYHGHTAIAHPWPHRHHYCWIMSIIMSLFLGLMLWGVARGLLHGFVRRLAMTVKAAALGHVRGYVDACGCSMYLSNGSPRCRVRGRVCPGVSGRVRCMPRDQWACRHAEAPGCTACGTLHSSAERVLLGAVVRPSALGCCTAQGT